MGFVCVAAIGWLMIVKFDWPEGLDDGTTHGETEKEKGADS